LLLTYMLSLSQPHWRKTFAQKQCMASDLVGTSIVYDKMYDCHICDTCVMLITFRMGRGRPGNGRTVYYQCFWEVGSFMQKAVILVHVLYTCPCVKQCLKKPTFLISMRLLSQKIMRKVSMDRTRSHNFQKQSELHK
jgi:hypothetical protein